ncbi:hypothetical protein BN7_5195 [Wickerhamomyces ciferrii]|uniref:PXA domain-containing protein n=1 Tax=Wickerhamomyces ciferrii (strain ATCC 14091 / BCRC 22168 / CBS 111 / JCM 3599 / NBRC 0793 / NRRL Y-1031 F-60-10) TaxID=1206466 RepID=K0KUC4_WICCF|nr:uncharacterized protein BN7_5195 [Wickerhamomyces ciferrii]CCH45612.1 hypothetical protein BN7_5195 [Wickerhamomyces ciferrii]
MLRNEKKIPIRQRKLKTLSSSYGSNKPKISNNQIESHKEILKDSDKYLNKLLKKLYFPKSLSNDYTKHLPNLTKSSSKLDIQLYCFLGLLIKNFINKWYYKLSDSPDFINELIQLISKITKDLEKRLQDVNFGEMILDDFFIILNNHLSLYKYIQKNQDSMFLPIEPGDFHHGFDILDTHPGLNPQDPDSESNYLRILSKNILRHLLPPEEQKSELVMEFMKSLISDLILRIILEKLTKPYQIMEIISIICDLILKKEEQNPPRDDKSSIMESLTNSLKTFINLISAPSNPQTKSSLDISNLGIWKFLSNLFEIPGKSPILYSLVSSASIITSTTMINSSINNLISNITPKIINEDTICMILQKFRNILFPQDDEMGPSRKEPNEEEFQLIKRGTKMKIIQVLQKKGVWNLLNVDDDEIDEFLKGLEDEHINKHLILRILDMIIVKLIPELQE